jgi:hypothetical protein
LLLLVSGAGLKSQKANSSRILDPEKKFIPDRDLGSRGEKKYRILDPESVILAHAQKKQCYMTIII